MGNENNMNNRKKVEQEREDKDMTTNISSTKKPSPQIHKT